MDYLGSVWAFDSRLRENVGSAKLLFTEKLYNGRLLSDYDFVFIVGSDEFPGDIKNINDDNFKSFLHSQGSSCFSPVFLITGRMYIRVEYMEENSMNKIPMTIFLNKDSFGIITITDVDYKSFTDTSDGIIICGIKQKMMST